MMIPCQKTPRELADEIAEKMGTTVDGYYVQYAILIIDLANGHKVFEPLSSESPPPRKTVDETGQDETSA